MLKKIVSLSLIYALLLMATFSAQISAQQIQPNALKTDTLKVGELKTAEPKIEPILPNAEVKKVFSKELQKSKSDASNGEIDFKKLERIEMKNAAKAKMSKKEKTWLVVFLVALTALVVVVAVYGKVPKCSDVSCNPDTDEGCICDE